MESLKDYTYTYIKLITSKDLKDNREALYERLKKGGKDYINDT